MTGIDELELPRAMIARIVKSALPDGALLQKDAKNAISKMATIFISYLTATAIDVAAVAKHKTLSTEDILQALTILDFERFVPNLREQLMARKQVQRPTAPISKDVGLSETSINP